MKSQYRIIQYSNEPKWYVVQMRSKILWIFWRRWHNVRRTLHIEFAEEVIADCMFEDQKAVEKVTVNIIKTF